MKKHILIAIVLVGVTIFNVLYGCKNTNDIKQTGIVVVDTNVYEDDKCTKSVLNIIKNDLVYVISKKGDSYYVQVPVMSIPTTQGYIPEDCISFDKCMFANANYGVLQKKTYLYKYPSSNDVYKQLENDEIVNIIERNENGFVADLWPAEIANV